MDAFEKMKIIEQIKEDPISIKTIGNQSLEVLFKCGCSFVEHSYTGRTSTNTDKLERLQYNRKFYPIVCNKHFKLTVPS